MRGCSLHFSLLVGLASVAGGCLQPPDPLPLDEHDVASPLDAVVAADAAPPPEDGFWPGDAVEGDDGDVDGQEPAPFFPIPEPGSGEAAWWRMEWFDSPARPLDEQCKTTPADYLSLGFVVRDDPVMSGTLTFSFMRDEACMFWGGSDAAELQYHVRPVTSEALGEIIARDGFTVRARADLGVILGRGTTAEHRFDATGGAMTLQVVAVQGTGGWTHGLPLVPQQAVTGDYSLGLSDDAGFESLGPVFDFVSYPDIAAREAGVDGSKDAEILLRHSYRMTEVEGVETLYVLDSVAFGTVISCEEFWYKRGVGPYFHTSHNVPDYQACLERAAIGDPGALSDPLAHARENTHPSTSGWAILREHCVGPDCYVATD